MNLYLLYCLFDHFDMTNGKSNKDRPLERKWPTLYRRYTLKFGKLFMFQYLYSLSDFKRQPQTEVFSKRFVVSTVSRLSVL